MENREREIEVPQGMTPTAIVELMDSVEVEAERHRLTREMENRRIEEIRENLKRSTRRLEFLEGLSTERIGRSIRDSGGEILKLEARECVAWALDVRAAGVEFRGYIGLPMRALVEKACDYSLGSGGVVFVGGPVGPQGEDLVPLLREEGKVRLERFELAPDLLHYGVDKRALHVCTGSAASLIRTLAERLDFVSLAPVLRDLMSSDPWERSYCEAGYFLNLVRCSECESLRSVIRESRPVCPECGNFRAIGVFNERLSTPEEEINPGGEAFFRILCLRTTGEERAEQSPPLSGTEAEEEEDPEEEEEERDCDLCDESYPESDLSGISIVGTGLALVCRSCTESLSYCDRCDRFVDTEGTVPTHEVEDRGETWCDECLGESGFLCSNCETAFSEGSEWASDGCGGLCSTDCAREHLRTRH